MKLAQLDTRETNCKHGGYRGFDFFISEIEQYNGVTSDNSDWRVNLPPPFGSTFSRANYIVSKSETNILIEDL